MVHVRHENHSVPQALRDSELWHRLWPYHVYLTTALREVKNRLCRVVDQVEREYDRVVIARHGKPTEVLINIHTSCPRSRPPRS